jgi:tetratricopeptide (TPR) repeat protein
MKRSLLGRFGRIGRPVLASLLVPALVLCPATAFGDGKKKPDASAESSGGSSKYKDACKDGNTKYAARDFAGAIAAYQKAIEIDPNNALGHYFLGEAQLAAGSLVEAEAAWNRASLAAGDKDPALRARILFVIADLKERQKKWEEARAAWQVYLDWANKYSNAGAFPGSAQSRQQVIDAMQKQDKAYAVVRQRIADTKAGNVFTDLSKPAPPR